MVKRDMRKWRGSYEKMGGGCTYQKVKVYSLEGEGGVFREEKGALFICKKGHFGAYLINWGHCVLGTKKYNNNCRKAQIKQLNQARREMYSLSSKT